LSKYILREVCKNVTDGEHGTVPCEVGSPYYLLSAKNLLNGKIILTDNERTISKQSFDKIRKRTSLEKDDVLISTVGTIGNLAIADEVSHYEFNRDVGIFKCNKEKLIPEYLYYYLSTDVQQKRMMKIAKGVTQKHLYISDLEEIDIDIPNVQEQSKAIYQLKKIDEKIGLNKKVISILESMAKTLYDYWFVQFDFPDANGRPYKTSGGKMEWNETLSREIPEGWEVRKVKDIEAKIVTGKTPSTARDDFYNGNIPFVTIGDIRNHVFVTNTDIRLTKAGAESQSNKYLPPNSLCVSCIASPGEIGFTTEWSQTNQQINSIVIENEDNRIFLYFALKDYFLYNAAVKTGNTFANMSKTDFSEIALVYPTKSVLKVFAKKTQPIFRELKKAELENQKLITLRDFLLPMLMNGQVTFCQ